jgi:hypothetical protein
MPNDESREHEEQARRSRTEAEAERAGSERLDEGGDGGDGGVLPDESDQERFGVMPPPGGSGAD